MFCIELTNPVTNNLFSDTDVILDSSPDSSEIKYLSFAPPVSEIISKCIGTGSTVQSSSKPEKMFSSSENSITPTVAAQRFPLSRTPMAPAITQANTPRPIHLLDPSDIDPPLPLPPPLLTNTLVRKSQSFKHRKTIDATICGKQTISALRNENAESTFSANLPDVRFQHICITQKCQLQTLL